MTAISPMEVERFSEVSFRSELIDTINGFLRRNPGVTVVIPEEKLEELVGPHGDLSLHEEMQTVASLYRALTWRVIHRAKGRDGEPDNSWLFNARYL